jgi:hypothetical protein
MKSRYSLLLFILAITFSSCDGEFDAQENSITLLKPEGLCQGGISTINNQLIVPFSWSIDTETGYKKFKLEIIKEGQSNDEVTTQEITGTNIDTVITLERGKNYQWKIIGTLNSGEDILTTPKRFFSESEPVLDILPLPSQISITNRTDSFNVTWSNRNEDVDNLSYNVYLSDRIESGAAIDDVTLLSYTQQGDTRFETDNKEESILKSSLSPGDYIVRVETIKTENGITNRVFSFSRFEY